MGFLRNLMGYVAAVIVLTVLAVIAQTGFVLSALSDVGASLNVGAVASMMIDDLVGFGPIYGALIAIGLIIALPAAFGVYRLTGLPRTLVYAIAGAVCIGVMLFAMEQVFFGIPLVAGARTSAGYVSQLLAGLVAGWAFARLTARPAVS